MRAEYDPVEKKMGSGGDRRSPIHQVPGVSVIFTTDE
jgi:hypothetical protein